MKFSKQALFMIGNAVIGLFTCYLYLYVWIAYSFGESMFNIIALSSVALSFVLFFLWNLLLLRKEPKKYWKEAIFTYVSTIVIFILVFRFL